MIAPAGAARPGPRGGIKLPAPAAGRRPAVDRAALDEAVEAGRALGFVARDPQSATPVAQGLRAAPRRGPERDKMCVSGPRRVTGAFRSFCARLALSHWEGLDRLMRLAATATANADDPDRSSERTPRVAGPSAKAAPDGEGAMFLRLPDHMIAWVEARIRSARYLDAGDYVRDLIRRDQSDARTILALEAALSDALGHGPAGTLDVAAFVRCRAVDGPGGRPAWEMGTSSR